MEIPYAVKPRPDTGLYNAKVGIWLFLASEVMLFGALFSSYILLRVNADRKGPGRMHWLNIRLGMINTFVLILSSVTVVFGWASLKMGNFGRYKFFQGITLLCALTFLGIKVLRIPRQVQCTTKSSSRTARIADGHIDRANHGHERLCLRGGAGGVQPRRVDAPAGGGREARGAEVTHVRHPGSRGRQRQGDRKLRAVAQFLPGHLFCP